jgi:peroxiredoxin Q/BCP
MYAALAALVLLAAPAAQAKMLAPGDAFPDWQLTDQTGKPVASRDLAGRSYLLWYYPKAETPGCTAEGLSLSEHYADFQARGVEIIGVSFDTPAANAAFVKAQGFPFRLLSDTDRRLAVEVGAAESPAQPVAARVSYLVGPEGRVQKVYPKVDPRAHAREVLGDLAPAKP